MNFSLYQKPSRYINNEVNSVRKDGEVKVALAFPDIYDIGMSHLGLRILYKIINDLSYASAERVFHPWLDLEKEMKQKGMLLSSLETERPLKDFDIVGFSLQYELSYTTVLNMLSIGGIPIRTEQRLEGCWPLVIAGGPCTVNPMPMSPFIDAFLIGDGEEAVVEILDVFRRWKEQGDGKKESLLKALAELEGIFVPLFRPAVDSPGRIERRYIESLDSSPYPDAPVVPYSSIVHDRVNIEVSRGCTMGCRFCQAGMIYRPLRERNPEKVLDIAERSLQNTGHDEVSFTSLSAGDYSCLLPLMNKFNARFSDKKISLSLPSLRVAAVNKEILREIKSVRKTGFTMAPEAATARLRNVINKDFTEEDYEKSLRTLFEEGWHNLKLYFMIGLPTETKKDIEAIPEMALRALKIAKKNTGRYVNISITLSPFVPKPHTPFQWHGQENIGRIKEKLVFLKDIIHAKKLKAKAHNEEMSFLEAIFARGDEKLSGLIERAWLSGCRLDAWTESFDFNKWLLAIGETGMDASAYAEKKYRKEDVLPWDIIDTGIKKEFLYKEFENAVSARITANCRNECHACGLKCKEVKSEEFPPRTDSPEAKEVKSGESEKLLTLDPQLSTLRVRVEFSKTGRLRYLSHLELVTAILRVMRRADVRLLYSQGFHPSPRVSFGPALSVGVSGIREYFDMVVSAPFAIDYFMTKMNSILPEGLRINDCAPIPSNERSLNSFISRYEYMIKCDDSSAAGGYLTATGEMEDGHIEEMEIQDRETVRLILVDLEDKKVKLAELLPAILNKPFGELDITRLSMYGRNLPEPGWKGEWVTPMERNELWLAKS